MRVLEKIFGPRATAVMLKILHPLKYPGLGVMCFPQLSAMFTCRDSKDGELSNQALGRGVNIASYDELFDQSECPILIFTSGNYTDSKYYHLLSRF